MRSLARRLLLGLTLVLLTCAALVADGGRPSDALAEPVGVGTDHEVALRADGRRKDADRKDDDDTDDTDSDTDSDHDDTDGEADDDAPVVPRAGDQTSTSDPAAKYPANGQAAQLVEPGAPRHPEHTRYAERVAAQPAGGTVLVRVPGSDDFKKLAVGASLPVGSTVDATDGLVEIASEASPGGTEQNAVVTGGVFRVDQDAADRGRTDLTMSGGDFSACANGAAPTARAAAARRRTSSSVARGLWAAGKGRFRTKGRHAAATVRGTRWAIVDRCASTTVKVFDGVVDVFDEALRRTIAVRAGERHVARPRGAKR